MSVPSVAVTKLSVFSVVDIVPGDAELSSLTTTTFLVESPFTGL